MKNSIGELKNTLERMNSRLSDTEECTSDLEDRIKKIARSEQQKEKQIKENESSLRDLWDYVKHTNIHITGVPEGGQREKEIEKVLDKIMVENFPKPKKETDTQVQEAQRVPNKMNLNRSTPRHIIIKMAKVKERILKAAREKQKVIHKGIPVKLSANFFFF